MYDAGSDASADASADGQAYAYGPKDPVTVRIEHRMNLAIPYVRLIFAEPDGLMGPGARVFSVRVQDKVVLSDFDIVKSAGGPNRAIVREFRNIPAARTLTVELDPTTGEAILCGVVLVAE